MTMGTRKCFASIPLKERELLRLLESVPGSLSASISFTVMLNRPLSSK